MSSVKTDADSLQAVKQILEWLGCPDVRDCEKDPELVKKLRSPTYRFTPDLVAGPIVGAGSPEDFYIDVAELQGETVFNPHRSSASPHPLLTDHQWRGTVKDEDLPTDHWRGYEETLNKKLSKYSEARRGSPMVGLCIHLDVSAWKSNGAPTTQDVRKLFTRMDYSKFMRALFDEHVGTVAMKEGIHRMWGADRGRHITMLLARLPWQMAFFMHSVRLFGVDDLRALMIVNDDVCDAPFPEHPVVKWLRSARNVAEERQRDGSPPPGYSIWRY